MNKQQITLWFKDDKKLYPMAFVAHKNKSRFYYRVTEASRRRLRGIANDYKHLAVLCNGWDAVNY